MPQHLDLRRDDIELLGDHLADLGQQAAVMIAAAHRFRDLMNDIDARQVIRDWLPATLLALVCGNRDLIVIVCLGILTKCRLTIELRLIEQTDLIGGPLFTAARITTRQGEIQLLSEGEDLDFVTLVLCRELFVANDKLIELCSLLSK